MNVLIAVATFLLMEAIAWLTHKYLMHGWLWSLHKDHHRRDDGRFLEKNDFFFLIFAIPAFILFLVGTLGHYPILFWIAVGITAYGAAYFLVHDIFIHQRFRLFRNTNNAYLQAIRRAHKMHHKHLDKEDGECFGMLLVPWKYFVAALKSRKA
jgi:beta-carotene 3-hydroxylase